MAMVKAPPRRLLRAELFATQMGKRPTAEKGERALQKSLPRATFSQLAPGLTESGLELMFELASASKSILALP